MVKAIQKLMAVLFKPDADATLKLKKELAEAKQKVYDMKKQAIPDANEVSEFDKQLYQECIPMPYMIPIRESLLAGHATDEEIENMDTLCSQ